MVKVQYGIVAYDDNKKSSKIFEVIFNEQFKDLDVEFVRSWDNVDSLIDFTQTKSVAILNELHKILILDKGFNNQIDATKIVEDFISLQEVFNNRGVTRPYLSFATSNQDVYDIFKKGLPLNGHPVFAYQNTRVFRLSKDSQGQIAISDLEKVVNGDADETALSIRTDYESRSELIAKNLERTKNEARNSQTQTLSDIRKSIFETDDISKINKDKHKNRANDDEINTVVDAHDKRPTSVLDNIATKISDEDFNVEDNNQPQTHSELSANDKLARNDKHENLFEQVSENFASKKSHLQNINLIKKIDNEKSTTLFAGKKGSGTTSLIYNLAAAYEAYDKKVLIINIDQYDDIIQYYPGFKTQYHNKEISNVFKTDFKVLGDIVVEASDNIHIISDIGINQHEQNIDVKTKNLERIISYGKNLYDEILIDGGQYFNEIMISSNNTIDNIVFVTSFDDLENLDTISYDAQKMNEIIAYFIETKHKTPGIIVTQVEYRINDKTFVNDILSLNSIIDRSRFIGYIAYDKTWKLQKKSSIPYMYHSDTAFNIINNILIKVVV